jgi:phosphatidylglycerol:prolipoprotein diacylglycerol transferase
VAQSTWSLPVHPAQAYGIINALVLAAVLSAIFRLRTREGQVFAWLLVLYPITRFMLEYIRDDNPNMALTPAQGKCLILTAAGLGVLWVLRRLPASCGPGWADRAAATEAAQQPAGGKGRQRKKRS